MSTYHIEDILGTRSRVAVLRVLVNVEVPLSVRQIARQAGISHVSALEALDALSSFGIAGWSIAGRSRIHWLDRRNLITRDVVLPVFEAEGKSNETLLAALRSFVPENVYSAVLFGSYARGDMRPGSDIDVLLVGVDQAAADAAVESMDAANSAMMATFGAPVSAMGYTLERVRALRGAGSFIDDVFRDGVVLRGAQLWEWEMSDGSSENQGGGGQVR
jgi:predicted nucleotidyltransferase